MQAKKQLLQHEPVPASLLVQERLGLTPHAAPQHHREGGAAHHWNLGANYYLARGQVPPPAGSISAAPTAALQPPHGCLKAAKAEEDCSPMDFCPGLRCPPATVPLWQEEGLVCAGPGLPAGR